MYIPLLGITLINTICKLYIVYLQNCIFIPNQKIKFYNHPMLLEHYIVDFWFIGNEKIAQYVSNLP